MNDRRLAARRCLSAAVFMVMTASRAAAVTHGMVDDFQSGATAGWGGGATVTNVADAGPAGAGDRALRVSAGARVAIVNTAQWTGDFRAAGITELLLNIRNENAFPLQMRIGLASGVVGSGGSGDTYVSAAAVTVPADDAWHRIALSLAPVDLIAHTASSNPTPNAAAALANVSHLRILHNPIANFLGASGPAVFTIDNISALPEPGAWTTAAIAAAMLMLASPRTRRFSL